METFRQCQRIVVSWAGLPLLHMPFGDPASGAAAVPLTCRAAAAQGSGAGLQRSREEKALGGASRSSPCCSSGAKQSTAFICCSSAKLWRANSRAGGCKALPETLLSRLFCSVKESMCTCACVSTCAWMEREDEVMIPPASPGQLTFPWRFLIKLNVRPTKKASLGGWHHTSLKNTHRHTSQIKAIYYLLERLSGIPSPPLASLWPKSPFLICLTGPYNA